MEELPIGPWKVWSRATADHPDHMWIGDWVLHVVDEINDEGLFANRDLCCRVTIFKGGLDCLVTGLVVC
jgi:hypothetical protein